MPFAWKGVVVLLLGLVVYGVSFLFEFPLPSGGSLIRYLALGLVGLGVLGVLIGAVRRNAFTYLITDSDVVVQKQLLRRSVRRIPFSSISDVQVSKSCRSIGEVWECCSSYQERLRLSSRDAAR